MPGVKAGPFKAGVSKRGRVYLGLRNPSNKRSEESGDGLGILLLIAIIVLILPWGLMLLFIVTLDASKRKCSIGNYLLLLVSLIIFQILSMFLILQAYPDQLWNLFWANWCVAWIILGYAYIHSRMDYASRKKYYAIFTVIAIVATSCLFYYISDCIEPAKYMMLESDEVDGYWMRAEGHSSNPIPVGVTSNWQREYSSSINNLRIRILLFKNPEYASNFYHEHITNLSSASDTIVYGNSVGTEGSTVIWETSTDYLSKNYYYSIYFHENVYVFVRGSFYTNSTWIEIDSIARVQYYKIRDY